MVGLMGEGINDAPALRAADIGISVDGAVDTAREAADIILLEKSRWRWKRGLLKDVALSPTCRNTSKDGELQLR